MAVIGKRFKDAGFKYLVIESEMLGPSSVESAFKGKAYNYAMRMHKFVYTAMWRQKLDELKENVTYAEVLSSFIQSQKFTTLSGKLTQENLTNCREEFNQCYDAIEEFEATINDIEVYGPTAAFWQSYLDMVQILFDFNKSLRTGNWELHLQAM